MRLVAILSGRLAVAVLLCRAGLGHWIRSNLALKPILAAMVVGLIFAAPAVPMCDAQTAMGAPQFAIAEAPYRFSFPRDHAAHPAYRTEWWYFTGHIRTSEGRRFGYELTFFRFATRPGMTVQRPGQSRWRGNQLFPAHFAITDEASGRFVYAEQLARDALGAGYASDRTLNVRANGWSLRGVPTNGAGLERLSLHAAAQIAGTGAVAIDFEQTPRKPLAIHGESGVSRKAACRSCASHYYSYTRLHTTGALVYGGQRYAVDGISWMDHEFGSDELQADQAGWDWFSLQLDGGREVMLYRLRQKDGSITPASSGSIVEADGRVRHLRLADFNVESISTWTSPHTGGRYPNGWRVRIPSIALDVLLQPTAADQELANTNAAGISYWEGAVDVMNAADRSHHVGLGYVELTGYARPVAF